MSEDFFTESLAEEATLTWFVRFGDKHLHGQDITPSEPTPQEEDHIQLEGNRNVRSNNT